jgi:hypothetical protein
MDAVRKKFRYLGLKDLVSIITAAHKGIRPALFYSFAEVAKCQKKISLVSFIYTPELLITIGKSKET